ncbi:SRPBCC family protein [Streptomyces sp. CNQ085]|uniref:SRPBCC family protein n=1 Tax=Streptomyces sp. CNQ085 TaxID=2886944 RepID=UPI001F50E543|nr:SRPBCC family protein [Streptomyces sp. CNQ085]MCI0383404.1 SRPBCC family protein [Streptomyces sp. CNQ085]
MPQVRVYVSIPLPVEEVFGRLADGCGLAAWHSGVVSVCPVDPREGEYRYRFPGRRRECVLRRVVCEPPRRVSFQGQRMWTPLGWQMPRFDFRLWPWEGGGCRVEVGVRCALGGAMVLLWPVVTCGWRRDLPTDAQALYERLTGAGERETGTAVTEAVSPHPGPGLGSAEPAWRQAGGPPAVPSRPPRSGRRFPAPNG